MAFLRDDAFAMAIVQAERHEVGIWTDLNPRQIRQIRRVIQLDQRGRLTYDEVKDELHKIARDHTTGDHRWIRVGQRS